MSTKSLHDVIETSVELAAPRASQAGLSLHCHISQSCKTVFGFDPWPVSQLLANLLSNALAYTETGDVSVYATCDSSKGTTCFELRVEDTGPGISPAVQEVVFLPPDQRSNSDSAEQIGIGLVTAQQLSEMLQSKLTLEDRPGGGTIARVTGTLAITATPSQHPVQAALRNTSALIVDNDVAARRLVTAQLRSWGIHVETVLDTASGIDVVREYAATGRRFSMVFLSEEIPRAALAAMVDVLLEDSAEEELMLVTLGLNCTGSFAALAGSMSNAQLAKPVRPSALFDCLARHPQVAVGAEQPSTESTLAGEVADDARRVLLVEDNIVNQCVATEILKRIGVQVEVANNGVEALNVLRQRTFDFVFMDCQMPEMDGYEATRRIRGELGLKDLPIVALTANALSGDRQRCLDAGMSDYLTKPFTREQLETTLDKWLNDSWSTDLEGTSVYSDTVVVELIDEDALGQIRALDNEGDSTIFDEIVQEYLTSSRTLTEQIDRASETGSCDEVARCAHALKSSSAAVGLGHFGGQCAELETLARDGNITGVRSLWTGAHEIYRRSLEALSGHLSQRVA